MTNDTNHSENGESGDNDIAIVGLAAHLPGAVDAAAFWSNLRSGVESIRDLGPEDLAEAGITRAVASRPGYVTRAGTMHGVADFDAEFFGLSPKEAAIMDPQQRHFLMAAWEALEDAGHVPDSFDGAIGVFAGCGVANYYIFNLVSNQQLVREVGLFLLRHTGNDKDFLATRASYLFDLTGPSVNVQTACSTSLVAIHLAVSNLLSGECDLALAGGVTIEIPHATGYQYEPGEVLSPDGHCRAFDHRSAGTVFGSGVGVVALRRLEDALADGDQIYAVIKGTAVNNDGARKVGYLAPSVDGQASCIAEALGVAGVDPASVSYVECHGTGTPMGDPIEIAALTQAFRPNGDKTGWCRIGSVKTNIGHLDTAAGVASVIKVGLALRHGELPPSLNFEDPNPQLGLPDTPFVVNDELTPWRREGSQPRRAGVNSLGVGGTNAFAVLEEPPLPDDAPSEDRWRLLVVSGRTRAALDANAAALAAHLRAHPDLDLADVSWTLLHGRKGFSERRVVAARSLAEAADLLERNDPRRVFSHTAGTGDRAVAFMFSGGGSQYPRMAADLAASEPVFAEHLHAGIRRMREQHGVDLEPLLLGQDDGTAAGQLQEPSVQLPAIFIVEHALARLLQSWGIEPTAMVGHSLGENAAACIAGTFRFDDAVDLVALRGRLVERIDGATVAVPLGADELAADIARHGLDLAVVNAPELTVVSGSVEAVAAFEVELRGRGVEPQRVGVRTAAHSQLLDPVLPEFRARLDAMTLSPPSIPWVSNRTGTWITDEEATDPGYWVDHLRSTVRFSDCIAALAADPGRVLLEVGPGKMLSSLARMTPELKASQPAIPTMRHADEVVDDEALLLTALGRLWAVGGELPVERLFPDGDRRRVALPTYAFQQQTYFIKPGTPRAGVDTDDVAYLDRDPDTDRWFWVPTWRNEDLPVRPADHPTSWLVFRDATGIADELVERFRSAGDDVVTVTFGDSYQSPSELEYVLAPENGLPEFEQLFRDLVRSGHVPDRIAHLALLAGDDANFRPGSSFFHRNQEQGFHSLVAIAKAWSAAAIARPLHLAVTTMGSQRVVEGDVVAWPEQATVLGPVRVMPRELPDVTAAAIDVDQADLFPDGRLRAGVEGFVDLVTAARETGLRGAMGRARGEREHRPTRRQVLVDALERELRAEPGNDLVALRRDRRFVADVERVTPAGDDGAGGLRDGGVVVISGGLGGIGTTIAHHLFEQHHARLVLVTRTALPPRDEWDGVVARLGGAHQTSRRIAEVRRLEERGAEVMVVGADVADMADVERMVGAVRARFGSIDGVVHAAGTVSDDLIVNKTDADLDVVLSPKLYGTLVLEQALRDEDLDLFVVFSSTSTVTAPVGQVDYVAANAFLNAFAQARRAQGHSEYMAVDWGIWNDVGMAFEAVAEHVAPAPEVRTIEHPWFEQVTVDRDGVARFTARWTTERIWMLDDHRTAEGDALVPGTGYVALARAALEQLGVDGPFEVTELTFLRPLGVADGDAVEVQIVLSPTDEGYRFAVRERVAVGTTTSEDGAAPGRSGWRVDAEATLRLRRPEPVPAIDVEAARAECPTREPVRSPQQDHLQFGPRWQVVDQVQSGARSAVADLRLPDEFVGDLDDIRVHPGLLDLGTGFAMSLIDGYTGEQLWVPVDYESVTVHGALPQRCVAVAHVRPGSTQDAGFATFDVTLAHPDGTVAVVVAGFTIKRLDGALDVGIGAPVAPADVELDVEAGEGRPRSPAELALRHNVSQGIGPDEGAAAFDRAVALTDHPVVYVTSMDLERLRAQSAAAAASAAPPAPGESSTLFARPALAAEYVAPRNDVEAAMVAIWQELLGIDQIGVDDDFFELGGHSLIAVRLFARIKRQFSVDFPMSVLFEAPTVASCARLVLDAQPKGDAEAASEGADDASGVGSTVAVSRPRYEHLVAMHPGEPGPKTPFFLVAGMFGNVLNLRHLAQQIGVDRPFYGVQAKGIFGDDQPHDDFREMAAAYLGEIRQVQPHGPYLLGGFSGGGITAFEMAQQLRQDGEETGLLVMLDTALAKDDPLLFSDRLKIQRDRLVERGPIYAKDWAVGRIWWRKERRRRAAGAPATDPGALHSQAVAAAFFRALATYDTQHYPGTITLYRPPLSPKYVFGEGRQVDHQQRFLFDDNGWGRYCDHIDVIEVPGDHDSMVLEPNVRIVAGHLRQQLAGR